MDCQEVEVRVKARQDGVLLAIFDEVGCGWCEKVGAFRPSVDRRWRKYRKGRSPVFSCLRKGPGGDTEAGCNHVRDIFNP